MMMNMPSMLNAVELALIASNMAAAGCITSSQIPPERAWYLGNESCRGKGCLGCSIGPNPPQTWPGYKARRWMRMLCDINSNLVPLATFFHLSNPFSCTGPGQEESSGGDQSLHHPVPGQCGLPDQCLSQQCTTAAGHPGLAAAAHGVLHQPHLPGQKYTQIHTHHSPYSCEEWYPTSPTFFLSFTQTLLFSNTVRGLCIIHGSLFFIGFSLVQVSDWLCVWLNDWWSVCLLCSCRLRAHTLCKTFTTISLTR